MALNRAYLEFKGRRKSLTWCYYNRGEYNYAKPQNVTGKAITLASNKKQTNKK